MARQLMQHGRGCRGLASSSSACAFVHTGEAPRLDVLRVVGLQATHERGGQRAGQVGVLAKGLMPAAPARVPEDVDVGPEAVQVPAAPSQRQTCYKLCTG